MKIAIIGAGATGSIYGGHLSLHNEVYLVDTISGSVVRASHICGVPAPTHEMVVNIIHALEGKNR